MDASSRRISMEHKGVLYHFCSRACLENFIAHPMLYLGSHADRKRLIKKRSFKLDTPVLETERLSLHHEISQMMGIKEVVISGVKVSVTYDLLEATAVQIERALEQAGAKLGAGWPTTLKRGWVHYTEETELDNLDDTGAACCNRPPPKA